MSSITEEMKKNSNKAVKKRRDKGRISGTTLALTLMTLPMIVYHLVFSYAPMFGVVIAFKRYTYDKGIWGSDWVGFKNFEFFLKSPDSWRITRNTLAYSSVFIILGLLVSILLALMLYEIKSRTMLKAYQTAMFFPRFLSWVVVAYMVYSFLNPRIGMLNIFYQKIGIEPVNWYTNKTPWIFILPIANLWKTVGYSTLIYYAKLIGINPEYYEAAQLEGASKWQIASKIYLPFLYPLITILLILDIGKIFNADFGLFYQLPMDSALLYETTDVIETYVYRALSSSNSIDMASAAGLYKSFVGFVLVILTNWIVNRINPENSLF